MASARPIRGLILDIDGTLFQAGQAIPGAAETVAALRRGGLAAVFVTNALEDSGWQAERLSRAGIPAEAADVITAPQALIQVLGREMPGAAVFPIGQPALSEALIRAGFRLCSDPDQIEVVIASYDPDFDYRKLVTGFRALKNGARFLATNADPTVIGPDGETPDAGAVIGALEGCSGRKLEAVTGKPSPIMLEAALARLSLPGEACLIVGDGLATDIRMGWDFQVATALVLSGVTRRDHLYDTEIRPDAILDSILDLPSWLGGDTGRGG